MNEHFRYYINSLDWTIKILIADKRLFMADKAKLTIFNAPEDFAYIDSQIENINLCITSAERRISILTKMFQNNQVTRDDLDFLKVVPVLAADPLINNYLDRFAFVEQSGQIGQSKKTAKSATTCRCSVM